MTTIDTQTATPNADAAAQTAEASDEKVYGLLAEYETVGEVMEAAKQVRDAGYKLWDVHSPFPIHGIDPAMGIKYTCLPWIVLCCGLTGMMAGFILQVHTNGFSLPDLPMWIHGFSGYEYLISGKPLIWLPNMIPVMFETTILLSAFGAVFGMFLLNRLPRLHHPLFGVERFKRATDDRFFIVIKARDAQYDAQGSRELLESTGAHAVEVVPDA